MWRYVDAGRPFRFNNVLKCVITDAICSYVQYGKKYQVSDSDAKSTDYSFASLTQLHAGPMEGSDIENL